LGKLFAIVTRPQLTHSKHVRGGCGEQPDTGCAWREIFPFNKGVSYLVCCWIHDEVSKGLLAGARCANWKTYLPRW